MGWLNYNTFIEHPEENLLVEIRQRQVETIAPRDWLVRHLEEQYLLLIKDLSCCRKMLLRPINSRNELSDRCPTLRLLIVPLLMFNYLDLLAVSK